MIKYKTYFTQYTIYFCVSLATNLGYILTEFFTDTETVRETGKA